MAGLEGYSEEVISFVEAATVASAAISAATGRMHSPAIYDRLIRGRTPNPLWELGGPWAPPPRPVLRPPAQDAFTGTYVTLDDYAKSAEDWDAMPEGIESPESLARHLLHTHDRGKLLWSLARMNQLSSKLGNPPGVVEAYRERLPESWRPAFDRAMRKKLAV